MAIGKTGGGGGGISACRWSWEEKGVGEPYGGRRDKMKGLTCRWSSSHVPTACYRPQCQHRQLGDEVLKKTD